VERVRYLQVIFGYIWYAQVTKRVNQMRLCVLQAVLTWLHNMLLKKREQKNIYGFKIIVENKLGVYKTSEPQSTKKLPKVYLKWHEFLHPSVIKLQ